MEDSLVEKKRRGRKPKNSSTLAHDAVEAITHDSARRKNIPPAGLEAQGKIPAAKRIRYDYNPHLPPVLRWSLDAAATDRLPELLQTARALSLTEEEVQVLAAPLRKYDPWLEPDFLVKLKNGPTVLLEVKGRDWRDTGLKNQATCRWVAAVNNWAGLGTWDFLIVHDPQTMAQRIKELVSPCAPRRVGFLSGEISVPDDFDRMGEGEIEAMFENGA